MKRYPVDIFISIVTILCLTFSNAETLRTTDEILQIGQHESKHKPDFAVIPNSSLESPRQYDDDENTSSLVSNRLSRISGGENYNLQRLSKVWRGHPGKNGFQFRYRWTQFSFSTEIAPVDDNFVKPGDPVRGIMFADVCISSKYVPCTYGSAYKTLDRIAWALNTLAKEGLNFWMMGGDNLYDEDGAITEKFFSRLSPTLLTKVPMIAVPGNHDFWTRGSPSDLANNQYGYGYAQYYMMDTEAFGRKEAANGSFPFNFPSDPKEPIRSIPSSDNFFHFSTVGSAGFIAYSGAHAFDAKQFERACRYFHPNQPGGHAEFIFLLGHWSTENMGCQKDMFTARVFQRMGDKDGPLNKYCYPLVSQKRIYFIDGHFHDNLKLSEFGMRVGGMGMIDTGAFGFPVVEIIKDSQENKRLLIRYVALAQGWNDPLVDIRFYTVKTCTLLHGFFECLNRLPFVHVWVNATATPSK